MQDGRELGELDKFINDEELVSQEIFLEKSIKIENKLKDLGITEIPLKLS